MSTSKLRDLLTEGGSFTARIELTLDGPAVIATSPNIAELDVRSGTDDSVLRVVPDAIVAVARSYGFEATCSPVKGGMIRVDVIGEKIDA